MTVSFYEVLEINNEGCLSPAGPLELAEGETPVRLDVWVWQDGGACAAVLKDFPDSKCKRWKITANADDNHAGAKFQPGAAIAKGLMVSKTTTTDEQTKEKVVQTKTFEWTKGILLVDEKKKTHTFTWKGGELLVDGKVPVPELHSHT